MTKKLVFTLIALVAAGAALMIPVGGSSEEAMSIDRAAEAGPVLDLSGYSAEPPAGSLNLVFVHHSCGGQWLADPGEDIGERCVYESHPNGGGLRRRLEADGYSVHEASYGSVVGHDTDWHHWAPKFRDQLDEILRCSKQDETLPPGETNRVVMFKSCYPNNFFVGEGSPPGEADGTDLTLWNAKAAYRAVLNEFEKRPDVLFVAVTSPPLAPKIRAEPLWKWLARRVLGKPRRSKSELEQSGEIARRFNNWLKSTDGWLAGYEGKNVVVFDYFDILTDGGRTNLSAFCTGNGYDSHPSRDGNERATEAFPAFLNRAVRRAAIPLPGEKSE
jgi:hypothetical protein